MPLRRGTRDERGGPGDDAERDAFKHAAVERVDNGAVLGTGSTAAFCDRGAIPAADAAAWRTVGVWEFAANALIILKKQSLNQRVQGFESSCAHQ
jgi:hypothetical protein